MNMVTQPLVGTRHLNWSIVLHPNEGGQPSKTKEFDEVVVVDLKMYKDLLDHGLGILKAVRGPDQPLFEFSQKEFAKQFRKTCAEAGLEVLKPHTYHLRHSGPSHDKSQNLRTLLGIKIRGRWKSDSSLTRYQKEGRVSQQLSILPPEVRARAIAAPRLLKAVLNKL